MKRGLLLLLCICWCSIIYAQKESINISAHGKVIFIDYPVYDLADTPSKFSFYGPMPVRCLLQIMPNKEIQPYLCQPYTVAFYEFYKGGIALKNGEERDFVFRISKIEKSKQKHYIGNDTVNAIEDAEYGACMVPILNLGNNYEFVIVK